MRRTLLALMSFGTLALHAASPARQLPGTIVVAASEFYDRIPPGDFTSDAADASSLFNNWLFNNSVLVLGAKEDAVATVLVPEAGLYHLFVRSRGAAGSSFKVQVDGRESPAVFGTGPLALQEAGTFELKKGNIEIRLNAIQPRATFNVMVLTKNAAFDETALRTMELPEEVTLLKDYKIPNASIIKFGDVDGDKKPDFLVITNNYSAYMYGNDGRELWHWESPAGAEKDARLRGEFEAPGTLWDFDHDGFDEVIHWRMIDDVEWLVMADGRTGEIKHKVRWPTPVMPHVYNNFRTAVAKFHPGYADNLVVFTDSGGVISVTAYDRELKQIWQHTEKRKKDYFGHYVYPVDVDGDGIDEVLVSHLCLNAKGGTVWQNDAIFDDNHDHMDAMEFFDIDGDGKPELLVGQSDVGALAYNARTGELLWQNLADHTQQITAGFILKDSKTPQIVANGRVYGTRGSGGLAAQLYWFDNKGNLLHKWPRNPIQGNPNFVRGDWYGNGTRTFFWHKFRLDDDGRGTQFFKETVYHMFDFLGNGAEQVVTWDRGVLRVYGYTGVRAKAVMRDSEYKRNSVANHTHY